ncbi:MAG TPA: hypothetical protein VLV54_01415 [Thermoanaerobaculia bacterium]|nr:hypothetical protein [Thermoanaerobaculia bacterium]
MSRRQTLLALAVAFVTTPWSGLSAQTLVGIPHGPNDPHNCNYLSSSGCQDKAVFSTASFDTELGRWIYFSAQNSRILVNVSYDSHGDGVLDSWRWPTSKVAVDFTTGTAALGTVLANDNPAYFNPATSQSYRRVMYLIYQGDGDPAFGHLCLSYSNALSDADDWTAPIAAVFSTSGSPRGRPCTPANGEALAESIAGFQSSAGQIDLFGLYGNASVIIGSVTTNPTGGQTQTYYVTATPGAPDVITVQGMVVSNGMYTATTPAGDHDYFFRNIDASYDPATGTVYLLRVTPYPFDVNNSSLPCSGICTQGLAIFPLRGQIYTMNVGTNLVQTTWPSSSWTLVADIGNATGWQLLTNGICVEYPLQDSMIQRNVGVDLDSLSVHKKVDGTLYKTGGAITLFGGGWKNVSRKQSCVNAQLNGATWGGSTWIDAELYSGSLAVP